MATKRNSANELVNDPPDSHYKTIVAVPQVHVGRLGGRKFGPFNKLMLNIARAGALEHAISVSANRETGAHDAKLPRYEKLQAGAIRTFARELQSLLPQMNKLIAAAAMPFAHPPTGAAPVTFARVRQADGDLAKAIRLLAHER